MKTTKNFTRKHTVLVGLMTTFVWACSGNNYTTFKEVPPAPVPVPLPYQKVIPSCQLDPANYRLNAKVVNFYMTGGGSVGGGIDLVSGFLRSVGLSYAWTTFQMNSYMEIFNSLEPNKRAAEDYSGVKKSNSNFGINVGAGGYNLGFSSQSLVVMEEMVKKAFLQNLKNIDKKLSTRPGVWETAIGQVKPMNNGEQIILPVGEVAGLKVGDKLQVFKGDFSWEGGDCIGTRTYNNPENKAEWIADIEVLPSSAGYANSAYVKVISLKEGAKVQAGDIVRFKEFAPKKKGDKARSSYKYSVRIENLISLNIKYDDGRTVDMNPYIQYVMEAAIQDKFDQYYVK